MTMTNMENLRLVEMKGIKLWVSRDGEIFDEEFKEIHQQNDRLGYKKIQVCRNGKKVISMAHRVIAKAFIENPENKPFVNHKNAIKFDNRPENLEWVTPAENSSHAKKLKLYTKHAKRSFTRKMRDRAINVLASTNEFTREEIASLFNVTHIRISQIVNKTYTPVDEREE